MVLPADAIELREAVLQELHASTFGVHLGHIKLQALVQRVFYWLKLGADMCKFCSECYVCYILR